MKADVAAAMAFIERCSDPKKLRVLIDNARDQGNAEVRRTAQLKLYSILPSEKPGTVEHDVWQSIYALEGALAEERGKTILLSRTRQKISRDGEIRTVADLVTGKPTEGFTMLIDRAMPELTFEAVALRHPGEFSREVLEAAQRRLDEAGGPERASNLI